MEPKKQEKTVIEQMAEDLQQIREALDKLEKIGISRELMGLYIQKHSGVPITTIRAVLEAQKEFLREAFKKVV